MTNLWSAAYTILISAVLCLEVWDIVRTVPALSEASDTSAVFADHLAECRGVNRTANLPRAKLWLEYSTAFLHGQVSLQALQSQSCLWSQFVGQHLVRHSVQQMQAQVALLSVAIATHIVQLGALEARGFAVFVLQSEDLQHFASVSFFLTNSALLVSIAWQAVRRAEVVWWLGAAVHGMVVLLGAVEHGRAFGGQALAAAVAAAASGVLQTPAITFVGLLVLLPWGVRVHRVCASRWWHTTLGVAEGFLQGEAMQLVKDREVERAWREAGCPAYLSMGELKRKRGVVVVVPSGVLVAR